jgi:hypothetical protein
MSRADCSTWQRRNRLESDYEQARWAATFTAESGFFLAARLRRLFLMAFAGRIGEGENRL